METFGRAGGGVGDPRAEQRTRAAGSETLAEQGGQGTGNGYDGNDVKRCPVERSWRRLALRAIISRPPDQPRDPRLRDRPRTPPARLALSSVNRILGQKSPFQPQHGSIPRVEARPLQLDRFLQDLADRPVHPAQLASAQRMRPALGMNPARGEAPRPRRCCRCPRAPSGPSAPA